MFDLLFTGARVVDGSGAPSFQTDVAIEGDRIAAVGALSQAEARKRLDVSGKVVCPGFIDAHVHGDLAVLADPLHEPAVRQGVTTYILGQDGVAMAPGSAATLEYMRRYTAGFSGTFPIEERWTSMAEYLSCFKRKSAVNVACLIPNGNVRMEVIGLDTRPPRSDELRRMGRLVREAMEQGAMGLSSGLDYIPSRYASTEELIALCREIAPYGGVYVTHMRRYDPAGVIESMEEVYRIGREGGVPVHISHFNSRAELVLPKLDAGRASGLDVTFDLYCYLAGSSILGMVVLPPEVQEGGVPATVARLRDPAVRSRLRSWFASPKVPLETVKISFVNNPAARHYEGLTLTQAFQRAASAKEGKKPGEIGAFVCDLLADSDMAVGCVVPHSQRTQEDVRQLMRHPGMMAGSDGIFAGSCPHPRGCGCFARYLGHHVRGDRTWTLEQAVHHLSHCAARRFGLRDRGLLRPNMAADVVVFDADTIADQSTYDEGRRLAVGIEHVVVNGELVLTDGKRTAALPGRPLRPGNV
jgi:N-acyl-D-amino-acid deacylase